MTGTTRDAADMPLPASMIRLPTQPGHRRLLRDRTVVRLFLTVWLVYTFHFASDIVRETYLALSLGESASIRVDRYMGLHPDLFEIEGRGAFINNNPGASMLGAIPWAIARPAVDLLFRIRPGLAAPKPAATYDDPRPNRTRFFNEARARGLDIRLGLAAASIHAGLMVPLGAGAAVLVFLHLRGVLRDERTALWLALLYAFGTPIFFRTAFLNQNVIIAHAVLAAYVLTSRLPRVDGPDPAAQRRTHRLLAGIGALLGLSLLCDYSGAPLALAFGLWVVIRAARAEGAAAAVRHGAWFTAGALPLLAILFAYQWRAFGHPFLPAQAYMPATEYSVFGWNGFIMPRLELMWRNLIDPRYGLFAFSPVLALAAAAPLLRGRPGSPTTAQLSLIFGATAALYLFLCSVAFAFLQWNTGVRYMVPAVPLLFMAAVPVLLRLPGWARWAVVIPTVCISWAVAMMREAVPESLVILFLKGFALPWLTVLQRTSSGYLSVLEDGGSPLGIFLLVGVILWLIWRRPAPHSSSTG